MRKHKTSLCCNLSSGIVHVTFQSLCITYYIAVKHNLGRRLTGIAGTNHDGNGQKPMSVIHKKSI